MNIAAALEFAAPVLREAGVDEFRREASSLLAYVLQRDDVFLIAHPEHELTADKSLLFKSVVRRRAGREPFQYITRRQEFYGLEFEVGPGVLIPRPETELLVHGALDLLSKRQGAMFCELGVGSGCVCVSILHQSLLATAIGTDISRAALVVARRNAATHNVDRRLTLLEGDLLDGLGGQFDLILSNPPYIPEVDRESLQPEVREFEPPAALFGGSDGLSVIRRIVDR